MGAIQRLRQRGYRPHPARRVYIPKRELAVEAVFGLRAEVQETGAVTWSMDTDAPLPGEPDQAFVVRVHAAEGQAVDRQRLDLVVSAVKPAQVVHRVEVVTATG